MGSNYDPEDLDPEEQQWAAQKAKAAARRANAHSMAGGPSLTEKQYDEQRRAQMERDQAATRAAAITPGSLVAGGDVDPLDLDLKVSLPGATAVVEPTVTPAAPTSVAVTTSSSDAVFWTCRIEGRNGEDVVILYASTWEDLKARLTKHDGLWTATEHRFPNTPANILGFFVPSQHLFPANTAIKQFEIIVKDGKVFKAEA